MIFEWNNLLMNHFTVRQCKRSVSLFCFVLNLVPSTFQLKFQEKTSENGGGASSKQLLTCSLLPPLFESTITFLFKKAFL